MTPKIAINVTSWEIWEPDEYVWHWCYIHEGWYVTVDQDYHGSGSLQQGISSLTKAFQVGLLKLKMSFDAHLRSKLVKVSTYLKIYLLDELKTGPRGFSLSVLSSKILNPSRAVYM